MADAEKVITYHFRGQVERFRGGQYHWIDGYSENSPKGNPLHPWMTKEECREDAKKWGCKARFLMTTTCKGDDR
jgi:hypothetical protein